MFIYQGSIITNFLSQNGQQYRIPVYQRNYEWSWDQCDKLFEDIVMASQRNQLHFCGSIVFQPIAPTKGLNNNIIIDGQQRLTTIYILLKALVDMAVTDSEKMLPQQALFNSNQFGVFQVDDTSKLKLKPAKENNVQLINLLYDKQDQIDKNCEIYRNYSHFCELIKEKQEKEITVADIYRGIGLLTVAVIQLDGNDKAQEIFERINSTGIPLNLADKIRNYVLMTDIEQDRLYDDYWTIIEQKFTKDQLCDFFIDYLNIKVEGFPRENEAYEVFKKVFVAGEYTNESMLKETLHYAEFYHTFLYGDAKYGDNVNRYLESLRRLNQTTVFMFLFKVFDDYENEKEGKVLSLQELEKVLSFLLNYSIRRLICEVGSNSLRGLYKTLYSRVYSEAENKKHYYDALVSFFRQLTSKDALPDDTEFILALKEKNLYRKNALCKYLLTTIENKGKEKIEIDNLSIEHIMPQNKNLSSEWQKMLGKNWVEDRDKYLHTLGNLTLTGYNSELGDKPFSIKLQKLEEYASKIKELNCDVLNQESWNVEKIQNRASRLAHEITELFPIIEPEHRIEFKDPKYNEYSCETPNDAKNKKPNYYVLQGERIIVSTFADMLRSIVNRLYNMNPEIIREMAEKDDTLVPWSQIIMFSYDPNKLYGTNPIGTSGIYYSVGFSASYTMYIIKELLDKYEIEHNEFVYSARPNNPQEDSIDRIEIEKQWCERKCGDGMIFFERKNSTYNYVRFTTAVLNSIIPESSEKLSPWKTSNYYFYEITNSHNKVFIALQFYNKGLSFEMQQALNKIAKALSIDTTKTGYVQLFKSSEISKSGDDTEDSFRQQLDTLYDEVFAFESGIKNVL